MRKLFGIVGLFVIFFLNSFYSSAVVANPEPFDVVQADGSTLTIRIRGDERYHFKTTIDGFRVVRNSKGIYEYAKLSPKGKIIANGIKANNPKIRQYSERLILKKLPSLNDFKKTVKSASNQLPIRKSAAITQKSSTVEGKYKLLVILANFSDTETSYTQEAFNKLMNENNYNNTGSFRDFYLENSKGKFDVNTTVTSWVTVSKTHDYYGLSENNWVEFAYDAVNEAYKNGVDFSEFDNDNDGVIDGIAIIHQGNGQESTDDTTDIWSHQWNLTAAYQKSKLSFNGVLVDSYSLQPELNSRGSNMSTIGVMCHEFGHIIGAYDFYDTDYEENGEQDGTGNWDLMASGAYNRVNQSGDQPAHHNAYTKMSLGWLKAEDLVSPGQKVLHPVIDSTIVYKLDTKTSGEYFLLENRINKGFDVALPGNGMIIYHVDENHISEYGGSNDINAYEHQGMYIKYAGYGLNTPSCPFPGANNVTDFTDETEPSSLSWNDEETEKAINSIKFENNSIIFEFMEGVPLLFEATIKTDTSVHLSWLPDRDRNSIIIAYSQDDDFGKPNVENSYSIGDTLDGGDVIIYEGSDTLALTHFVNSTDDVHYYRIWSNLRDHYSTSVNASIIHPNMVRFYIADELQMPLDEVYISVNEQGGYTNSDGYIMFKDEYENININVVEIVKEGFEIKKMGFKTQDLNDFKVTLKEDFVGNLEIENDSVEFNKTYLSWNPIINEDFSNYKPFQLDNPNWIFKDEDELLTNTFSNIYFENEGAKMSYMVFDGFTEGLLDAQMSISGYVGKQFLAHISSPYASDDWLISPEFEVTDDVNLNFIAQSIESSDSTRNLERIRVLISESGSASTYAFSQISEGDYTEVPNDWTPYSFDLSDYDGKKIRFAIQCVSFNGVMLCLDRIKVSNEVFDFEDTNNALFKVKLNSSSEVEFDNTESEIALLKSGNSSIDSDILLLGAIQYEIYRNDELIAVQDGMLSTEFVDSTSRCGEYTYTVKAVKNELTYSNNSASISVDNCDYLNDESVVYYNIISDDLYVQLPDGVNEAEFVVYNINGGLITSGKSNSYYFIIDADMTGHGIYFVKLKHEKGEDVIKVIY